MPKSGQRWSSDFLGRSALLEDFRDLARPLLAAHRWPTLEEYTQLVESERRARAPELRAVRFAPPLPRRRRMRPRPALELADLYDGRVVLRGEVPCLAQSYHDFCNVLAWAAFPRSKRALHARQLRALEPLVTPGAARLPNRRTREQDALTLFDEGGSLILAGHSERPRVVLFGHGLMEHVSFQQTVVGSAALMLSIEPSLRGRALFEAVDRELSRRLLDAIELSPQCFDRTLQVQASHSALE
jgi:hypothetical protein